MPCCSSRFISSPQSTGETGSVEMMRRSRSFWKNERGWNVTPFGWSPRLETPARLPFRLRPRGSEVRLASAPRTSGLRLHFCGTEQNPSLFQFLDSDQVLPFVLPSYFCSPDEVPCTPARRRTLSPPEQRECISLHKAFSFCCDFLPFPTVSVTFATFATCLDLIELDICRALSALSLLQSH